MMHVSEGCEPFAENAGECWLTKLMRLIMIPVHPRKKKGRTMEGELRAVALDCGGLRGVFAANRVGEGSEGVGGW